MRPPSASGSRPKTERRIITLRGAVQGLGVRPTVVRLARSHQLRGSVSNDQAGVRIDAYGDSRSLTAFLKELAAAQLSVRTIAAEATVDTELVPQDFSIGESQREGPTATTVPLDRRVCHRCIEEMNDPSNRRFQYPFISCTQCGPRYSIIESMPYDRPRTSMARYRMCDACRVEYENPDDRRCHSQTNCCFDCGPQWWMIERGSRERLEGMDALNTVADRVRAGDILAMKGLGGYQLICDATNEQTVMRLREAKRRPRKPLAVMVKDLDHARKLVSLCPLEIEALQGTDGPIVVADVNHVNEYFATLHSSIHPGLRQLGVMLPTTPMHHWLASHLTIPLVVTSGNVDGDPLLYDEHEADERFRGLADIQLHHDRAIIRPIDDSVVRCIAHRRVTLRAGRGLAPVTLPLIENGRSKTLHPQPSLAVGGHQKAAFALCNGFQVVLGPHVGDLHSDEARQRYLRQIDSLDQLYACRPRCVAHDDHPDYFSTRMVDQCVNQQRLGSNVTGSKSFDWSGAATISVQHHHAHVVAAMLEHGWLDRTVLGVAMDGTGYGEDGTIWGGEFLLATASRFQRVGHLRPFRLAGGETAVKNPERIAIALVAEAIGRENLVCLHNSLRELLGIDAGQIQAILEVLRSSAWSPTCSSVGRLFDGIASIVLNQSHRDQSNLEQPHCSYEGELAMRLESVCDVTDQREYSLPIAEADPFQLDWRPMIQQLIEDRGNGVTAGAMAMRFHRGIASAIVAVVHRFPGIPVVLTGGVFQNRILVELITGKLECSRQLGLPGFIPVNDGGLAAGQLAVALSSHSAESQLCV